MLALGRQFLIHAPELWDGQVDLPPDFQAVRRPLQQREGDGLDGPQVLGDILAHCAVAAGGALDEHAVLIG